MKNFSLRMRENSLHSSRKRHIYVALAIVVIVFFLLFSARNIIGKAGSLIISPLFIVKHYIETSSATVPVFIRSRLELDAQIQSLEQEISSRQGLDGALALVQKENEELRALLSATNSPRIGAGVIARPPHTPYDVIMLDRGSADGIKEEAPVYHGMHVLGLTYKVYEHTSLVQLLSSPGIESTVFIFGPQIFATAYGEGGGVVRLSIPQGLPIQEGDLVALPSIDSGVVGFVDTVQSISTEPEQHAYVTLSTPLQSLRMVSVGTKSIEVTDQVTAYERVSILQNKLTIDVPEQFNGAMSTTTGTSSSTTP